MQHVSGLAGWLMNFKNGTALTEISVLAVWQKPNFSTGGSFSSKFQKYISK
jgi:hypothetical protein